LLSDQPGKISGREAGKGQGCGKEGRQWARHFETLVIFLLTSTEICSWLSCAQFRVFYQS